jgi:stress-induced morphogen
LSVIDNNSQHHIAKDSIESHYKLQVLEDFIASLPAIESEQTVK